MIIWEAKLDEIYDCKVVRINDYSCKLTVTNNSGEVLLEETLGLMYGAKFGPDISDIYVWQQKCIAAIDA